VCASPARGWAKRLPAIVRTVWRGHRWFWRSSFAAVVIPARRAVAPSKAAKAPTVEEESDAGLVPLMVLYGSETGTAQEYSNVVQLEAKRHGFRAHVVDLEHFVPEMLSGDLSGADSEVRDKVEPMLAPNGPLAVFLMATCGEGDFTGNAQGFYTWVTGETGDLTEGMLENLRFAVFGLGNKGYEHFNAAGKITDERLAANGGKRVFDLGLGDDDGDLESDFGEWRERMWAALRREACADLGIDPDADAAASAAAAASAGPEGSLPPKDMPEYSLVFLSAPVDASGEDTARDDLDEDERAGVVAALGGTAPVAPGRGWAACEPLRLTSRRALLEMGRGSDPVRRRWFEAVPVPVKLVKELRQKPTLGSSTVHVDLDVGSASLSYHTADDIAVLAENEQAQVEAVCKWLGYDPSQWFTISGEGYDGAIARREAVMKGVDLPTMHSSSPEFRPRGGSATAVAGGVTSGSVTAAPKGEKPPPFPVPCTVGHAMMRYCDLNGLISKATAGQFAHWATDSDEKRAIATMLSSAGRSQWDSWVRKAGRSVAEFLEAFPSIKPPVEVFLHICNPLHPREYTVASSSLAHPAMIQLAVSVLDEPKAAADRRDAASRRLRGVCSNYFARSPSFVRLSVRSSTFKLPADSSIPVIMIGPGTGLAPMRAFCQEREALRRSGKPLGEALLFFGCRKSDEDFIYREELARWADSKILSDSFFAFSREGDKKVYVQHLLEEQGARVWALIRHAGAHVYVCGATTMGGDVVSTLKRIASTQGGLSAAAASKFVEAMEHEKRLIQELWS
jgi:NADPH-ferrihemoprotein reductase